MIALQPAFSESHGEFAYTITSSKGWSRTTGVNNLGLPTSNTLNGIGIPTTNLSPVWRADGSLESVSLNIGGDTHTASFNPDHTLATLTVPGRGNILGGHSISNGVESLTIAGVTHERTLDDTGKSISGANVINRSEALTLSSGGTKSTTTPAVGSSTETFFNAAGAPTMKLYADASGETYGYTGELLTSISLARGGALALDYSNDGAKDHIGTTWPAMQSGPFNIASITESYGYDRAGRRNFIGDNSGGRALVFHNGRLVNTVYNSGLLQGYEIIPSRDTTGRHTGTMIKRYGNAIHTSEKALFGASEQILDLASGGITATPQRDSAGNITGYVWSDGTNSVSQSWQRGLGGRIEAATNNVPGAPQFLYLIDPNDPEESFDGFGRRLKAQTAGGTWQYTYGIGGQLTSATHPTLGSFTYAFDAIGRRTDVGGTANSQNILNQTTAWEHAQAKTLTIKAHPDARVWFNGVEIPNFTGQHQATVGTPGSNGQWVPWETLAVLEGAGEGAGDPPANPHASPDARAEQRGAVWVPPTQETFTFDAAGNRESSAQWDFGWDAKNQLVRIRTKDHATAPQAFDIRFTYDSEGRRVQKHVIEFQNGTVSSEKIITFVWDGWDLLYERHQLPSGLTLLERKYLWGPDIANGSAGGAGGLLLIRETKGNSTTNIIPLYDGSGNITALADIHKNLLAEYVHGPFGERVHATGPLAQSNPWRWATKYHDSETGLYYFGKRFMDPITGQFLSRDPLGENESINLYQYTGGDPINKVDVRGLAAVNIDGNIMPTMGMNESAREFVFRHFEELLDSASAAALDELTESSLDPVEYVDRLSGKTLPGTFQFPRLSSGWGELGAFFSEALYRPTQDYFNQLHQERYNEANSARMLVFQFMHASSRELTAAAQTGFYSASDTRLLLDMANERIIRQHDWSIFSGAGNGILTIADVGFIAAPPLLTIGKLSGRGYHFTKPVFFVNVDGNRALRLPNTNTALTGTTTLGYTTPGGRVFLQPGLTRVQQASTLRHEGVHAFFSAKGTGQVARFRQRIGVGGYQRSQLLRYTEEAIAETVGSRSLWQGLRHPLINDYGITGGRLFLEGTFLGGGIFGAGYLGYELGGGAE